MRIKGALHVRNTKSGEGTDGGDGETENDVCRNGERNLRKCPSVDMYLQTISVTLTVVGNRKSVTVSDCHPIG